MQLAQCHKSIAERPRSGPGAALVQQGRINGVTGGGLRKEALQRNNSPQKVVTAVQGSGEALGIKNST